MASQRIHSSSHSIDSNRVLTSSNSFSLEKGLSKQNRIPLPAPDIIGKFPGRYRTASLYVLGRLRTYHTPLELPRADKSTRFVEGWQAFVFELRK